MSRLAEMQARFQQKQMQEKEEKLLRLYENQQQRAFDKVSRGSSGSSGGTSPVGVTNTGRVRQMFDERRQKAGIDRSYPLEPLKQTTRLNGHVPATRVSSLDRSNTITKSPGGIRQTMAVKTSVQRSVSHSQTGKPPKSRTIKHASHAMYTNGNLVEHDSTYEQSNDDENEHAIHMLKQQQTELEMMMNNHNIEDTLDDEELPEVDIDEIDEGNENNYSGQMISSDNLRENSPNIKTASRAPPPISNETRDKPTIRRTLTKPSTIVKSSPRSTPKTIQKKSAMKTVSGATKSNVSMPGKSSITSKPPASRSGRVPQSATVNDNLAGCKFCQRRFAPDRLEKHEEICGRTLKKKRKAYDATKHRVQGTEAEGYAKKGTKATSVKTKTQTAQKSDWRRQHEEFINAIRAAKQAQAHVAAGGKLSDLPPPPPSLNPDYVQCPHCGRRFNETAAARHIPKCATMLHNKPTRAGSRRK